MSARDPGLDLDPPAPLDGGHAARLAETCPMLTGDPPRTCHLCATPLPLTAAGRPHRGRRWCGDDCRMEWVANHVWQIARDAAVSRDGGRCVRKDRHEPEETVRADLAAAAAAARARERDLSDQRIRLGVKVDPTERERLYHLWRDAWTVCRDLDRELQRRIGALDLEVNHRIPRDGDGYGVGCWHHADNLETLCHGCHVEETTRQRRGLPTWRDDPRPIEVIEGRPPLPGLDP